MIETPRLILRRWRDEDRAPYAAMMADPEVGYWLGGSLTRDAATVQIDRFEVELATSGWGFLALEHKADGAFLGAAALRPVHEPLPPAPAVEIGWRLAPAAWGRGFATEAAAALLADGFRRRGLAEVIAFTAWSNRRSQAVMERIGMARDPTRDFEHPNLAVGHPLRPHIVYLAKAVIPDA